MSNEGRLDGGADYISAGTGKNTVLGGVGDDTIITGVDMQSTSADLRDAYSNDRDVVLGAQGEDGKRPGRLFLENGMRVYDLEVLGVSIGDAAIEQLLADPKVKAAYLGT